MLTQAFVDRQNSCLDKRFTFNDIPESCEYVVCTIEGCVFAAFCICRDAIKWASQQEADFIVVNSVTMQPFPVRLES